jgi:hypothetical protein
MTKIVGLLAAALVGTLRLPSCDVHEDNPDGGPRDGSVPADATNATEAGSEADASNATDAADSGPDAALASDSGGDAAMDGAAADAPSGDGGLVLSPAGGTVCATGDTGSGPCYSRTSPTSQSFSITNASGAPVTWTSSVAVTLPQPDSVLFTPPTLSPATSTLAPGEAATVSLSFPSEPLSMALGISGPVPIQISISEGTSGPVETMNWSYVDGYALDNPGTFDFGNVEEQGGVAPPVSRTVVLHAFGPAVNIGSPACLSPCQALPPFSVVSQSPPGSSAFTASLDVTVVGATDRECALTAQFAGGPNAPPTGVYGATFAFESPALCAGPVVFTATANLVSGSDAGGTGGH